MPLAPHPQPRYPSPPKGMESPITAVRLMLAAAPKRCGSYFEPAAWRVLFWRTGMLNSLIVFLGGGAGALARYLMGNAVSHRMGSSFPWHTLSINLLGSLLIGVLMEWMGLKVSLPEQVRLLLVVGFLGGYTTFSSFSLESSMLIERGDYAACAAYIAVSVLGGIALVFAGAWAVRTAF
jgi:fluoride exporter